MSVIKEQREKMHLTQQELSEKSGISVRTIQRIETGIAPKGHTLKSLAQALDLEERQLLPVAAAPSDIQYTQVKLINFASLPLSVLPPLNIVAPLLLMYWTKQVNPLTRQIVTLQIVWTLVSFVLFMLSAFAKKGFELGSSFMLVVMVILVLSNVVMILINTARLDRKGELAIRLNFNII